MEHEKILAVAVVFLVGLVGYVAYTQVVGPQRLEPPQPPLARINYSPEHPAPMQEVTFDGAGSVSPGGEIVKYVWTIDGTQLEGRVVHYSFKSRGDYSVTLKVVDSNGLSNTKTTGVTVR